jgi:hypothetical protein
VSSFEHRFIQVNRVLVGLTMAAIFILVFLNVVLRYGFGTSISWVEEVARFLMIWGAFLGAGLTMREGPFVAIDVFQDCLPETARHRVRTAIASPRARVPPMDYVDKLPPSKWYILTPPRWSKMRPPLTSGQFMHRGRFVQRPF